MRTYSELISIPTYKDRFLYLLIGGKVGIETFGYDRIFNQLFYTSKEWESIRNYVIARDLGRDLAMDGYDIRERGITVHHMNPLTIDDVLEHSDQLLNPIFLITTSSKTHKAIHYGYSWDVPNTFAERTKNDTAPWRK